MAVALDIAGTEVLGLAGSTSPQTYTGLTTSGSLSNGCVTFIVIYDTLTVTGTSATWDGVACTLIASQNSTGGTFGRVELWGLSPIGAHTGNKTFSITYTGGTAQLVIQGLSWTGANQTGGTTTFNHSTPATGNTNTPTANVTSQTGDAVLAGFVCASQTINSVNNTQLFIDPAPNNYFAAGNRAAGAASVTMSASLAGISIWAMAATNILQASSGTATAGGAIHDAGTSFARRVVYQSFTQPVFFIPPLTWNAWTQWPDTVPRTRPATHFTPWTFLEPAPQVWFPPPAWTDFVQRKTGRIDTQPSAFVPVVAASAQVWFPPNNWPDIISPVPDLGMKAMRGRLSVGFSQIWYPPGNWPDLAPAARRSVEFPQPAFVPVVAAATVPTMAWVQWPDFTTKPKPASFPSWTFLEPIPQIWYPSDRWPDTAPATKRVAQQLEWAYGTFITPTVTPTWTQWTQWPDFATKQKPTASLTPWTFLEPPPQVWFPPSVWPDFVLGAKRAAEFQALTFLALTPTATVIFDWPDFVRVTRPLNYTPLVFVPVVQAAAVTWNNWSPWPDIVPIRARPVADFRSWSFIEPPPQVWFPPILWPDILRGKPSPVDTQPSAFVSLVVVQTTPTLITQWPDFAKAKVVPLNYNPFAFVQTVTTPFNGFTQWPDFARKRAVPLNYDPLTFIQTIKTPFTTLTTWPDFAPIRGKAGLHAALQQFSARFPGVITQATITVIMSAFETNSDSAIFAISVLQSQPAVTAGVSIQEIGGQSATSIHEAGNT